MTDFEHGLMSVKNVPISIEHGLISVENGPISIDHGPISVENGSFQVSADFSIFEHIPSIKSFRFHNIYGSSKFSFFYSLLRIFFENCYFSDYPSRMSFEFFR